MGGSIKKKYQAGGSKVDSKAVMDAFKKGAIKDPKMRMNPSKIQVGTTKPMTPAEKKKAMDKFMEMAPQNKKKSTTFNTPKKQMGGMIPAKPIATAPIQGTMGRRGAAGSNMAKGGQKFPDLTGDGKVTKKDILKGRGVIKKRGGSTKYKYQPGGEAPVAPEVPKAAPAAPASPGFYDLAMQTAQASPRSARVALRNARKMEEAKATGTRRGANVGSALTGAGAALTGAGNVINAVKPGPAVTVPAGGMKRGGQKHPGFKAVQAKIAAKSGVSKKAAGAILAASTRKASAKAKAANPRLKRVKG
jgi:hypothetical protein